MPRIPPQRSNQAEWPISRPEELVYQLKISIVGVRPFIWRRVLVPSDVTLADLNRILLVLFGWDGYHLHDFQVPTEGHQLRTWKARQTAIRYGPRISESDWGEDIRDEDRVCLAQAVPHEKTRFLYTYDMGDDWEHEILVEKLHPRDSSARYPVCLAGARNAPIEDSGGIWGYAETLEILSDPKHEDYDERRDWMEDVFGVTNWDAEAFDLEAINRELAKLSLSGAKARARWRKSG